MLHTLRLARVAPRQPLVRMIRSTVQRGHRDALTAQVGPHLQVAVQRLRRAPALRLGLIDAGEDLGDRGVPTTPASTPRPTGAPSTYAGEFHAGHAECTADRCDPEPVPVFVDELLDQRRRGLHSRAKKLVAALSISIVI